MPITDLGLLLLALPLLLIDWQIAIIWAIVLTNAPLVSQLQALDFSGFEVWGAFLAVGALRRWIFRS